MENAVLIITIKAEITKVVNFALQQNRIPVIRNVSIHNANSEPLENVVLRITTTPEVSLPYEKMLQYIPAEQSSIIDDVSLILNAEMLAGLTERMTGIIQISLWKNDIEISSTTESITVLAYDEWHGAAFFPELLAAFVTPNHPEIIKLNARASEFLGKWTGNQSLDAYQSQNPDRVKKQAAAIYGALQEQNIVYSVPPASFEIMGQRVRLCDAVMQQHMGTCLDLTLLYASCLEAMGLRPLLILQKGHIFIGVWLEDLSFPESVSDDPALITKRLSDDIGEILIVECTALTAGKNINFDEAERSAIQAVQSMDSLEYIIDVHRARLSGIRPLPMRIQTETGWTIDFDKRESSEITAAPQDMQNAVVVAEGVGAPVTKKKQWERKLLDLGLRNTLINMRLSRNVIPILSPSIGELEDALASGDEFGIMSRPIEWAQQGEMISDFENICNLGSYSQLIQAEFSNNRLRSPLREGDLARAIINLYKISKTSLEENGANTLYLACGLLRWYETKASQKARYAPIVLLPVEIIRKSANKGYVIRLRDEEPQMNITLLEMLKQDFGITVSGLDPLPQDAHGVNMREVFAVIRRAVMSEARWDVLESSFLGVFSFSQFVMWNDMRNRYDDLEKNKVVKSLIDGKLAWEAGDMRIGDKVPEGDVYLPIVADASQLFAIKSAGREESFVLQGPPGTGKSQTITALIANALAQGKTILFVAEKMAALSVVQKRLNSLGIGPFCLELHSNKSRKKDVLEQLRTATEVRGSQTGEMYKKAAERTAALRLELDAYAEKLHAIQPSGVSLFEMVRLYETNSDAEDLISFDKNFTTSLSMDDLQRNELLLERLVVAAGAINHPHRHKLRAIRRSEYTQQIRMGLANAVNTYQKALISVKTSGDSFADQIEMCHPCEKGDWEELSHVAIELSYWESIPRSWAVLDETDNLIRDIKALNQHIESANENKFALLADWKPELLQQDGAALEDEWGTSSAKWLLPKVLGQNSIVRHLSKFCNGSVKKESLSNTLSVLVEYKREKQAADELLCRLERELEGLYAGDDTDWKNIARMCEIAKDSNLKFEDLTGSGELRRRFASVKEHFSAIDHFVEAWKGLKNAQEHLVALIDVDFDSYGISDWLPGQNTMCSDILENADDLREWMVWKNISGEAQKTGLAAVVSAYESGLAHDSVITTYRKAIYSSLIVLTVESDEVLNSFSGAVFNEKIEQFKRIDAELTELTKKEIFYRLAAKVPDFSREAAQSSELGILQRVIRSGGRGVSIRKLFEQIPNLLPRLCPCMLMSPISAAQYLDPKRPPFDIVVFDEASQLPTCKAVGALARGKEAIIVGDPNQMPPTSFFSGNTIDEENLDIEDLESILDDCLALGMPQTHLLWHYRSRHESLIAFSNSKFYENKLYTFPSVNDLESKVKLVQVDGCFDRGNSRQNRVEAEAIIAELIRRYENPELRKYTIGVVTFNISQQKLIDDLFTEACKTDSGLDAWANNPEEPLLIKNLENIQGDERDIILFSVGYGPDKEGKIFMNFGPLNREEGWRRLNVAVSRARFEMIVFSSLLPDQINLSKTGSRGVAALKAFLEYAQRGSLSISETESEHTRINREGIVEHICHALNNVGYDTQCAVGHSEYRIDIGVVDPHAPERYLLGILLDGSTYGSAKTTRDRELAQISVLNGLGWEIHRIWTMDWWDNSQKEIDKLLKRLELVNDQASVELMEIDTPDILMPGEKTVQANDLFESETVKNISSLVANNYQPEDHVVMHTTATPTMRYVAAYLPTFHISAEEYVLPAYTKHIEDKFRCVLNTEAPITEALLIKRVLQSCGIARAGNKVNAQSFYILKKLTAKYTKQGGQKIYWNDDQEPAEYVGFRATGEGNNKRDAKDVPAQEATNAICAVLEEQIGLPKEDLIRETAKKLGYMRTGPLVVAAIENGINYAKDANRILFDDYGYVSLLLEN